ncbi:MAG: tyrosine-protein phosphatase, partial [Jatrophihabitans sp.]
MTTQATQWIQLQGAVNVRDVGGLPTADGHRIRSGVLIRSANLQHLTGADVTRLVRELGVRRVVDLRTDVEVRSDRPGPIHSEPDVVVHHLSLYPDGDGEFEADQALDPAQALTPEPGTGPDQAVTPEPVLPWRREQPVGPHGRTVASYLRYLQRRPDSILAALRAIAEPAGATVVHCAA